MRIEHAVTGEQIGWVRALFLEYAASLDFELCFQSFDEELAGLPGDYAPPRGVLLLAFEESGELGAESDRDAGSSAAGVSHEAVGAGPEAVGDRGEAVEGTRETAGRAREVVKGAKDAVGPGVGADGRAHEAVGGVHEAIGCAALRPLDDETCEIKRLYVRPAWRGRKIGRALAERVVAEARRIGYKRMRLDAIRNMTAAVSLYASMGFKEIAPYRHNPIRGAVYMELPLE